MGSEILESTPPSGDRNVAPRRRWPHWSVWLIAGLLILLTGKGTRLVSGEMPSDLRSLYFAAVGFAEGVNIYRQDRLAEIAARFGVDAHVWPYLYAPPLAFYLSALPKLGFGMPGVARLWLSSSVFFGILVVVWSLRFASTIVRSAPPSREMVLLVLALAFCVVLPFGNNLRVGQVNLLVLACIMAAIVQSVLHDRDLLAGLLLSPAVLVKVTPLILVPFFVLNRRVKTLYGLAAGLALLILPTLAVRRGAESWVQFFGFAKRLSYGKAIPGLFPAGSEYNFSVAGWIARLTTNQAAVSILTWAILSLLGLLVILYHWRIRNSDRAPLLIGPYLILMVIASPLTYVHHVVYVYPGILLIVWSHVATAKRLPIILGLAALALAGLASIDFPMLYDRAGIKWALLRSLNLYALLALFVMSLVIARVPKPGQATHSA